MVITNKESDFEKAFKHKMLWRKEISCGYFIEASSDVNSQTIHMRIGIDRAIESAAPMILSHKFQGDINE